jgi:carbon monoxide dehydrogenase subunit G
MLREPIHPGSLPARRHPICTLRRAGLTDPVRGTGIEHRKEEFIVINVERSFAVNQPADVVVNYLKDFANATEWDPGTKSCTQESPGPVQVGTTWHNVSVLKGKETELTYRLAELSDEHILLVGENKTATSRDDLTVKPNGAGSTITYHAQVEFHGVAKLVGTILLKSEFDKLGDKTAEQMTRAINAL